jgi:hypothetical protein
LLGLRTGSIGEMPFWELRTRLLKFYWFRLADVMVPVAVSVVFARAIQIWCEVRNKQRPVYVLLIMFTASLFLPSPDRVPSQFGPEKLADWKEACTWIAAETPHDAAFLTPAHGWGFKWYAGRAEFVNYKDVPQDAAGIVEWNDRLLLLERWRQDSLKQYGSWTPEAVADLRGRIAKHGAGRFDYIVAVEGMFGPFELPPVYENETCRVYRVPEK